MYVFFNKETRNVRTRCYLSKVEKYRNKGKNIGVKYDNVRKRSAAP